MTTSSLLSPHWYRLAYLKPRLRAGVRVARHEVRGQAWYVLTDPVSGRHHRFNGAAYALIAGCDGQQTIDEIWSARVDALGDEAPTQAQAIEVFSQAFGANLLSGDVASDANAVMRVQGRRASQRRRASLNPLAFKLPLWNPDDFLDAHVGRVAWLFGRAASWALGVLALLGLLLMAWNAGDLARHAAQHLGQGRTLILLWIAYPLVKALHELGHAFAVKAYGGRVTEMGVTLLMLTPVPYVDASDAVAFENKRKRAAVGMAGIAVELLLATGALGLWLLLEPGLLRDIAYAVVVVGGVSTLAINGNPLLRFDGYHVLCDAFELPNLAQRSARWWQALGKRLVLGGAQVDTEPVRGTERAWLVAYAPLSWLMRGVLAVGLALAVADWNAWIGLALFALSLWWMVVAPAVALGRWLLASGELFGRRLRALSLASASLATFAIAAFLLPLPHRTLVPGVVALPDEALVRPLTEGFVAQVLVHDGQTVTPGTPLLRLDNEPLRAALQKAEAQLQQEQVERLAALDSDALRAAQSADRVAALTQERDRLAERVAALDVRAAAAGRVAIDPRRLIAGRWIDQGLVVAHVLPPGAPLVRALVANDDIALVRARPGDIEVALAPAGGRAVPGRWLRSVPRASTELSQPALSAEAGGPLELDPSDRQRPTLLQPRFEVELALPEGTAAPVGARAWVSFVHGEATLAELSSVFVRRAFLRHFRA